MSPDPRWTRPLTVGEKGTPELLGAKAHGLVGLLRLGLPVPSAFVVTTGACRAYLDSGVFPVGLDAELDVALARLESIAGRTFGDPGRGLRVSVRSGASVSMPGMMDTVLGLGAGPDPGEEVRAAIRAVFGSWNTPRARTYRTLHGIPHDLGTAVVVQTMVDGDRDEHSGAGVAFGRDPNSGAPGPYGEVLFESRGDAAVVARSLGRPAVVGVGAHTLTDGDVVTVDGTAGLVVAGRSEVTTRAAIPHLNRLLAWADEASGEGPDLPEVERLRAAHRALDRH